jgi:hypothetical protein
MIVPKQILTWTAIWLLLILLPHTELPPNTQHRNQSQPPKKSQSEWQFRKNYSPHSQHPNKSQSKPVIQQRNLNQRCPGIALEGLTNKWSDFLAVIHLGSGLINVLILFMTQQLLLWYRNKEDETQQVYEWKNWSVNAIVSMKAERGKTVQDHKDTSSMKRRCWRQWCWERNITLGANRAPNHELLCRWGPLTGLHWS